MMFLYYMFALMATPLVWAAEDGNDWDALPQHMTVLCSETRGGCVSWDQSEEYTHLIYEEGVEKFTCIFLHKLTSRLRSLELGVCRNLDNTIEIRQTTQFFSNNQVARHKIIVECVDNPELSQSTAQFRFVGDEGECAEPIATLGDLGARLSLKIFYRTLCVCAGDVQLFALLPFKIRSSGGNFHEFCFPPMQNVQSGGKSFHSVAKRRRVFLTPQRLLMRCLAREDVCNPNGQDLLFKGAVYKAVQRDARCTALEYQRLLSKVRGEGCLFPRTVSVCPYGHQMPGFDLFSQCLEDVHIQPACGVINTEGLLFPIMQIRYRDAGAMDSQWKGMFVYGGVTKSETSLELQLYARTDSQFLLIGCFGLLQSALNMHAALRLYCGDTTPYLVYPIADNLSLDVRLGQVLKDGVFYICSSQENCARIAFFAGRDGVLWQQQLLGVPEVCLDGSAPNVTPNVQKVINENRPLFSLRSAKGALNALIFYYKISRMDNHYNMCITTRSLSRTAGDGKHEVNVLLREKDIVGEPFCFWEKENLFCVDIAPKVRLCVLSKKMEQELIVRLEARCYIKDLCCFKFCNGCVEQKFVMPCPTVDKTGQVASSVNYTFQGQRWGVRFSNEFINEHEHWRYTTDFSYSGLSHSMIWAREDKLTVERVVCKVRFETNHTLDSICYYAYYTYQNGLETLKACGAVCADIARGVVFSRKASISQCAMMPDFSVLGHKHVQDWPAQTLFSRVSLMSCPRLKAVPDGVRLMLDLGMNKHIFMSPISHADNLLLQTLVAELVDNGCVVQQATVDSVALEPASLMELGVDWGEDVFLNGVLFPDFQNEL